ncbi:MAG: alpha/beta hydrolase [Bacteroidota bacterium]
MKVDRTKTPYTFGYLEVPENRERPTGKTIKLPVYIFKSRSANPAPDPVLYTVGGPGSSSLSAAPYMRAFSYLDDRDLILFEQRGTAYAQPSLDCPEWEKATTLARQRILSDSAATAILVGAAAGCRDRLQGQGIDLDAYNTREIAADIEDLRKVLHLDQLNLLTISYSTKIAQTMMRDYPASIRSVVMDSPLPLAASWDESSLSNIMKTYRTIFSDCAADSLCNNQYPNLGQRFYAFLDATATSPITLTVKHPAENRDTTVSITSADIATYLGDLRTGQVPDFPKTIDALINGNTEILQQQFSWGGSSGTGIGMRLSVWCSEETAYASPVTVAKERAKFSFLNAASPMVFTYEVCRAWGVRPAPPTEDEPISSNLPVLLINGSYDAITPVKWANTLHQQLPNSRLVIFPGWTHGPTTFWDNNCGMKAAQTFFNNPTNWVTPPCITQITPSFN